MFESESGVAAVVDGCPVAIIDGCPVAIIDGCLAAVIDGCVAGAAMAAVVLEVTTGWSVVRVG
ncbi:MAG: hypothetical protein AAGG08_07500, partial [Actinomycetota bacterium]